MLKVVITNKLSGTNMPIKYEVEDMSEAKKLLIELATKDDYFEVGDAIEIQEV